MVPEFAKRACQKTIWGPRVTSWQCWRKGVAQEREPGTNKLKWWCKQHLPSNEKARGDAREVKYRAGLAALDRRYAREEAERDLMKWALQPEVRNLLPYEALEHVEKYERNAG
jgi:hypothetical protein